MSNFICCECGTTHIDCGGAGYKTLKEIELTKKIEDVKALIKDGRFIEALQLLEDK